jgi:hypothetical protein
MWEKIRAIGMAFAGIKGWLWFISVTPAIAVYLLGLFEHRPWSEIISLCAGALAFGMALVYYGVRLSETVTSYLTSHKERERVSRQIKDCIDAGMSELDTATAAAIWAGTREEGDIIRHLRFRTIKAAISRGEIKNTVQRGGGGSPGPNIYTWIPIRELLHYFVRIGVASKVD